MQIKLATAIALLPFLARGTLASPGSGTKIALNKRSSLVNDGIVNREALQAHVEHVRGKIARGFANYEKNTGNVHPNYRNATALRRRATGTVALTDVNNELWQGSVSVGTPPVNYTVDFDTGSSDFFLPGVSCGTTCSGHSLYDPSKSSSSQDIGITFSLAYGDGSTVSGEQYSDTVVLGGLTATGQDVGAATQYSAGFEAGNFSPDGLMGMAFQTISDFNSPPVFQTLIWQGQTDYGEFGFTLLGSGSELFLGGVDTSKFTGSLEYTAVTEVGYWQIVLQDASVGNQLVSVAQDAIVDTGTTLVLADSTTVANLIKAIPGAKDASETVGEGFFTFPCDSVPDNVAMTLGGAQFTISADAINLGLVSEGSSDCVAGIIADDSLGFWILGDVFLRNVYTSFDMDYLRVGFASLN